MDQKIQYHSFQMSTFSMMTAFPFFPFFTTIYGYTFYCLLFSIRLLIILTLPAFLSFTCSAYFFYYNSDSNPSWYFNDCFRFYSYKNFLCLFSLSVFFSSYFFLYSSSLSVASSLTFLFFFSCFYSLLYST